MTYTYDGAGNRLTAVESAGARTTSVYDGANQLSSAQTGAAITTYSYDKNGNQTLQNVGGALTSYTWDEENRLTGIAYPTGARSTYVYSADGLRRKREETGVSLLEVWDGTQLLQEKDSATKAEVARYLLQNDSYSGLRAQRLASDNTWRFFAYDLQGNTRLLLNSDGTSNLDLLYRAFGQKQASSGAGNTLMQFGAFYGYEWDADSRMWVKARHLSGTQGRWLSQDPIGFGGGDWNLFRYVWTNPLLWADGSGMTPGTGTVIWGAGCTPEWLAANVCLLKESAPGNSSLPSDWFKKPVYGQRQTGIDAIYFGDERNRKIVKVSAGTTITVNCKFDRGFDRWHQPYSCCTDNTWEGFKASLAGTCCEVDDVAYISGNPHTVNGVKKSVWPLNDWRPGHCGEGTLQWANPKPASQRNRCGKK